jgi:N-acetylglucosamine kinase-like BadF-type ATPase
MRYYLGIDGGGTKTAAIILDENKTERGRGHGGPCNIATCDDATLRQSIQDAVKAALSSARLPADTRFGGVCAGVAGYTAKKRRGDFQRLLEEIVPAERHRLEPDFVIAYWGATEGEPGVIVSAGTGTVVYGINGAGETCRVDGRGFLLGDRGSGFDLGRDALTRLIRLLDDRSELTPFDCRLLRHIGGTDADDVIEWTYRDFSPTKIASLASLIGSWADEGDLDAKSAVHMAGVELAELCGTAMQKLNMPIRNAPVYLLGGLWNISGHMRKHFEAYLLYWGRVYFRQRPKQADIREPKHDPSHGAALLAIQPHHAAAAP